MSHPRYIEARIILPAPDDLAWAEQPSLPPCDNCPPDGGECRFCAGTGQVFDLEFARWRQARLKVGWFSGPGGRLKN
jgi:hypothetical protein